MFKNKNTLLYYNNYKSIYSYYLFNSNNTLLISNHDNFKKRYNHNILLYNTNYNIIKYNNNIIKNYIHITSLLNNKIITFNLADIGEGIKEVVIKEWNTNIKVGNKINEFDEVCEVESDKATVTITSRYSGIIKHVHYNEGDIAQVGKPLIDIEISEDVKINEDKNEIVDDNKSIKDIVETDVVQNLFEKSETIQTKEVKLKEMNDNISNNSSNFSNNWKKILATPSVRRYIKQYNINIKDIIGTGKDGRVLKEDIINFINRNNDSSNNNDNVTSQQSVTHINNEIKRIPIKGYVKGMFKSMSEANEIPSLKLTEEINMTNLKNIKNEVNKYYNEKYNIKLTYMPFFIKALSLCIDNYPILNSTIDNINNDIVINKDHNICIAVDTKTGLVVPNIKQINQLKLLDITKELIRLQKCAAEGKVLPYDLQNGTICISNVGNVGGILVQPIVIPKQVCIVAFGKIQILPRFVDDDSYDKVIAQSILNVTWAADHRVIDGATVARASNLLKCYIENPVLLLADK